MKDDIKQALRMIGHLLEHHPTTGAYSRDRKGREIHEETAYASSQASCWCIIGAQDTVSYRLGFMDHNRDTELMSALYKTLGLRPGELLAEWEGPGTTDQTRLEIARKLQNV
jgi:hypothetical protein